EPTVCGITSLGLDHTEVLGDTLDKIAAEKAGIIKPGVPVVCAPQEPEALEVVTSVASQQGSSLSLVGWDILWEEGRSSLDGQTFTLVTPNNRYHLEIPLLGRYQLDNAAVAVGIAEALIKGGLAIGVGDIEEGLRRVEWPCRLEVVEKEPLLLVDGAHNPLSAGRVVEAVRGLFPDRRILLLVGVQGSKDLPGLAAELSMLEPAAVFATRSRHPRAAPSERVYQAFTTYGLVVYRTESVATALDMARNMAAKGDLILATGSLFVAAEVRELVKGIPPETYPVFDAQVSPRPLNVQPQG
ncbi:MAG: bifunctional folylpolyglutamate synthase/dihydrofolate synthase, partial [Chloroflexi bacterium]|nr:bifunctional folylpolyglutamate synthase/dihydrofolate synthase [Chloroflexota bacterium]